MPGLTWAPLFRESGGSVPQEPLPRGRDRCRYSSMQRRWWTCTGLPGNVAMRAPRARAFQCDVTGAGRTVMSWPRPAGRVDGGMSPPGLREFPRCLSTPPAPTWSLAIRCCRLRSSRNSFRTAPAPSGTGSVSEGPGERGALPISAVDPSDGRLATARGVGSVVVIAVQPAGEQAGPGAVTGVGAVVGPLLKQGALGIPHAGCPGGADHCRLWLR